MHAKTKLSGGQLSVETCKRGVVTVKLVNDKERRTTGLASLLAPRRWNVHSSDYHSIALNTKFPVSHDSVRCKFVFTITDHLARSVILCLLPNKETEPVAQALIDRAIGIFGPPETLRSDQGPEFESKVVCLVQQILGYQRTRTTPCRPQGKFVSERQHPTLHAILAFHSDIQQQKCVSLLLFT